MSHVQIMDRKIQEATSLPDLMYEFCRVLQFYSHTTGTGELQEIVTKLADDVLWKMEYEGWQYPPESSD